MVHIGAMRLPLIVCGAHGRMGKEVIAMAMASDAFVVKAGVVKSTNEPSLWPIHLHADLNSALFEHGSAVVIDFSVADQASNNLKVASDFGAPILLATTGLSADTLEHAKIAAQKIPVIVAANTSLMANLLIAFCAFASARLPSSTVSILDLHHTEKKDAPSGTAKAMAHAITSAHSGEHAREIEIRSLRQGKIAGEHTASFFNEYDRLELTHRVSDRRIFAEGALVAAQFLFGRGPGLYDMNDVLNLNLTIDK